MGVNDRGPDGFEPVASLNGLTGEHFRRDAALSQKPLGDRVKQHGQV